MDQSTLTAILLGLAFLIITIGPILRRGGRFKSSLGARSLTPEQEIAIRDANKLWKSDPEAAQRIMASQFDLQGQRDEEELAALRLKAQTDRASAEELRDRLQEDLEVWRTLLTTSRKKAKKDPMAQKAVGNLEQWERETQVELEQLNQRIHQLNA